MKSKPELTVSWLQMLLFEMHDTHIIQIVVNLNFYYHFNKRNNYCYKNEIGVKQTDNVYIPSCSSLARLHSCLKDDMID